MKQLGIIVGLVFLLALVAEPIWQSREQWQFGPYRDDGIYMVAAKSLAAGDGYRQANLPDRRYVTRYPPVYPFFLSLAWRIQPDFPRVLPVASLLQASLLPIFIALIMAVLRQLGLTWRRTFLVAALTVVSFSLILLTITLYSELLFGIFLMAAIWTTERSTGRGFAWALAGGIFAGLAFLTRTAALPLFAAAPLFFFLRRRFSLTMPFLLGCVPMAVAWFVWSTAHAAAGLHQGYLDEYLRMIGEKGLVHQLLMQASGLSTAVAEELMPNIVSFLAGIPLYHLALAAAIAGGIRIGRSRGWPLALIFTALYLSMILFWWGARQLGRFLVPVWPVMLAGIAEEASHFAELCAQSIRRPALRSAPRWALVAIAICCLIRNDWYVRQTVRFKVDVERNGRYRDFAGYRWIREHAGPETAVLTSEDTVAYLYTGIPTSHALFVTMVPQPEEVKTPVESLARLPRQYRDALVAFLPSDFADFSDRGMAPFRAEVEFAGGARLEHSGPDGIFYRVPVVR